MDASERNKRDLPEVVAEILIEQHAMREEITAMRGDIVEMRGDIGEMRSDISGLRQDMHEMRGDISGLRQDMREGQIAMQELFNNMTNAILDAMNRGNDKYGATNERVDLVEKRVTKLETPNAA